MSVNTGENGLRFVQAEVEVPGSPEVVWKAIATGPGISSWFVPTTVEEREGGTVTADFGMGMISESTISKWEPPYSFIKDGEGMGENAPPVATEWTIEAKSGGTCLVRVVHSWFASTDDWDGQWEAVEQGWKAFFVILRLALEHFPGQPSSAFDASAVANAGEAEAWAGLVEPLGLANAAEGQSVRSGDDSPGLAGKVESVGEDDEKHLIVLLNEPGPGVCDIMAMSMGEQTYLSLRFFLFGEAASATVAEVGPQWTEWFGERFPAEA